MIPSKVPLSESFNDSIPPGKRYSFKQVIHQQRVLGRKVSNVVLSYLGFANLSCHVISNVKFVFLLSFFG